MQYELTFYSHYSIEVGDKKHVEISTQWNQEGRFFTVDHIFIDPICAGWVVPELWRGEVIILQWQPPPAWPVFPGLRWARGAGAGARGRHNVVNLTFCCSWKPANRNHVNLVLHFCHLAFVLLRHPLVEIIQYHLAMLQVECLRLQKILPYLTTNKKVSLDVFLDTF